MDTLGDAYKEATQLMLKYVCWFSCLVDSLAAHSDALACTSYLLTELSISMPTLVHEVWCIQANADLLMSANDTAGTLTAKTGPRTESNSGLYMPDLKGNHMFNESHRQNSSCCACWGICAHAWAGSTSPFMTMSRTQMRTAVVHSRGQRLCLVSWRRRLQVLWCGCRQHWPKRPCCGRRAS